MKDAFKNHKNHCLSCETKNCYNRSLGSKKQDCLETDYKDIIASVSKNQKEEINRSSLSSQQALKKKLNKNFAINWLAGFVGDFFGKDAHIGVVSCIGSLNQAKSIIDVLDNEGIKTAFIPCKLGGLEIELVGRNKEKKKHPGCNPIAQAKIANSLDLDAVIMVGLCIGHDMLFIKHCNTYIIPFITKMPIAF